MPRMLKLKSESGPVSPVDFLHGGTGRAEIVCPRMAPKSLAITFLFCGIGFAVGLPLGAISLMVGKEKDGAEAVPKPVSAPPSQRVATTTPKGGVGVGKRPKLSEEAPKSPGKKKPVPRPPLSQPPLQFQEARSQMNKLIKHNPSAAREVALKLPPELRGMAIAELCRLVASYDVEGAMALALALPPGEASDAALRDILYLLCGYDPDRALSVIASLPKDHVRPEIFSRIFFTGLLSSQQLAQAAEAVPLESRRLLVDRILRSGQMLASSRLLELMETLEVHPEDGGTGLASALKSLAVHAPEEAEKWLDRQPESPARDAMLKGIVEGVAPQDPARALTFCAGIGDAWTRTEALDTTLLNWLKTHRSGAVAWLRDSGKATLGAADQQRWLRRAGAIR